MARSSTNRGAAKASATGTAAASGSTGSTGGRRPGDREESSNTTADQAPAAEPAKPISLIVIADNPKRKNTKAYDFFAKYPPKGVMSTIQEARKDKDGNELVRGKDISWDADRRHILLGEEADNFPVNGSREEQAEYLRGLPKTEQGFMFDEKRLIAWGYVDAPVEEVAEATAEVKAEEAAAS